MYSDLYTFEALGSLAYFNFQKWLVYDLVGSAGTHST